jgi:large subunit ribosomal protein L4
MSEKLEAAVYTRAGATAKTISLPEAVFAADWNPDLVHEVVVSMQGNARAGTAHTKTRGEVRGGGKKPWRQKGTGRARHGSTRSPIWTGGGVAHGPRNERDFSRKINKNARAKALACVLSEKWKQGTMLFVDNLNLSETKAAEAKNILRDLSKIAGHETLATKRTNAALIVLPGRDQVTERSFQNFGNVCVMQAKDVSPVALLTYKHVIVAKPDDVLPTFITRTATKSARKAVTS